MRPYPAGLLLLIVSLVMGTAQTAAHGQTKERNYGNAPDDMLPYGKYKKPYKHFFEEPQQFLGPGRAKSPAPDLTSVKIGFIGPLEGTTEDLLGNRMLQGAILALEEANAAGGYLGLPFEFVIRNDAGLWGASSNTFIELDEEQVWAVLGSIDGASTHVILRVALKLELCIVNTGSSDPTLTETRIPWLIRCFPDDRQNSYVLADYIFNQMGIERVTVLRNNNRYGRTGIAEFQDTARRLGHPLLFELRYSTGDTDFALQLDRIRRANAEAVVIWGNAREAALIVKQMRRMGMEQRIFGADRLVSPEFIETAGEAAEGVVAAYPYNPNRDDPRLKEVRRRYAERFDEELEAFAAHAYDGMTIIIEAIRTAGLNRVRIRDVLASMKSYQGVTGKIIFDATLNDIGPICLAEVRDGRFHFRLYPLGDESSSTAAMKE